jgi:hypothetical protein
VGSPSRSGKLKKPVAISRRGGELLLRVLEQQQPLITAAAVAEWLDGAHTALVDAGALELHGAVRSVLVVGEDGPAFRDLTLQPGHNANGYYDAADGSVAVPLDEQRLLRVSLPWWLAWLVSSLELTNSSRPTALVAENAWDIGDLWIDRRRKVPVIFARRLHREQTCQALAEALTKRAGRGDPLVLTSGRCPPLRLDAGVTLAPVSLLAVLTNDADNFVIDRGLLLSPYNVGQQPAVTSPLYLSPDGRLLTIHGNVTVRFKSDIHVTIIRRLVEGYREGKRYSARELLDHAHSSAKLLRQAFGEQRWAELEPYLKSENGLWGFEL